MMSFIRKLLGTPANINIDTSNPTVQQLLQAKELVAHNWNRNGQYALDEDGKYVEPDNSRAVSFCTIGAVIHVSGWHGEARNTIYRAFHAVYGEDAPALVIWNDNEATKDEVLKLFDKAIEMASKGEPTYVR